MSAKTWAGLSLEDRNTVRQVGKAIMELQKDEAREAPVKPSKLVELLQDMYGMEVVRPSTIELEAFRNRTRGVFNKWSEQIGIRLVGEVERTIDKAK